MIAATGFRSDEYCLDNDLLERYPALFGLRRRIDEVKTQPYLHAQPTNPILS
jgi:hypothetical protein